MMEMMEMRELMELMERLEEMIQMMLIGNFDLFIRLEFQINCLK